MFNILACFVSQSHNRQHRVHPACRRKHAPITHKQALNTVYFAVTIGYCLPGVCPHPARTHLVGSEHHDAIDTHAMALQLAIKCAVLLLTERDTLWFVQSRALAMER